MWQNFFDRNRKEGLQLPNGGFQDGPDLRKIVVLQWKEYVVPCVASSDDRAHRGRWRRDAARRGYDAYPHGLVMARGKGGTGKGDTSIGKGRFPRGRLLDEGVAPNRRRKETHSAGRWPAAASAAD